MRWARSAAATSSLSSPATGSRLRRARRQAPAGDPVATAYRVSLPLRRTDAPPAPVIRPAEGRTGWRGMTAEHVSSFSRRVCVRAVPSKSPSINRRAQGRPGVGLAHGPPAERKAGGSHHRFGLTTRPSLRECVTAYTRSPRGPAFLPPSPREIIFARLGISTGMPGPHDFTVLTVSFVRSRNSALQHRQAIAPRLHVRDDREAPLSARRDAHI